MQVSYENFIEYLVKEYPEYSGSKSFKELFDEEDLKLPYIVLGDFIRYTIELFKKNGQEDATVQKFFKFVNNQFNTSSDDKLLTLLTIEVFENYSQEKESLSFARSITNEKARFNLETSLWWTGIDKPDKKIAPEAYVKRIEIENK